MFAEVDYLILLFIIFSLTFSNCQTSRLNRTLCGLIMGCLNSRRNNIGAPKIQHDFGAITLYIHLSTIAIALVSLSLTLKSDSGKFPLIFSCHSQEGERATAIAITIWRAMQCTILKKKIIKRLRATTIAKF